MDNYNYEYDIEPVNKDLLLKQVKSHIIEMEQNEKILQRCNRKLIEFQNE